MINMVRRTSTTQPFTKLREQKLKSRTGHPSWIKHDFILGDHLEGCYVYVLCISGRIPPPHTFITFISLVLFWVKTRNMPFDILDMCERNVAGFQRVKVKHVKAKSCNFWTHLRDWTGTQA